MIDGERKAVPSSRVTLALLAIRPCTNKSPPPVTVGGLVSRKLIDQLARRFFSAPESIALTRS